MRRGLPRTPSDVNSGVKPTTIFELAYSVYGPFAMLAGMQLGLFTPLKYGPMTGRELAHALQVRPDKLQPLLYALVAARLLTIEGDQFANTPEADTYLVQGRASYLGGMHEHQLDVWNAALKTAESIRSGIPQAKHDFSEMSDEHLGLFFRGLHPTALAAGKQLAATYNLGQFRSLLDVGGGSGGLAIAACQSCPTLTATVIELPRIAPIAQSFTAEAGLANRVRVQALDILNSVPEGRFDVAVLRFFIQVLGPDQARRAIYNIGQAIDTDGLIIILGRVLDNSRLSPPETVGINIAFLNMFDKGQSYIESEYRGWLHDAGFSDIDVQLSAMQGGNGLITARRS